MASIGLAIGLAGAAAYRAIFPLLTVSFLIRYTDLIILPQAFNWLSSTIGIIFLLLLFILEFLLDELPGVSFYHSSVYTLLKILIGGLLFSSAIRIDYLFGLVIGGLFTGFLIYSRLALEQWLQLEKPFFRRLEYDEIKNLSSIVLTILAIIAPSLCLLVLLLLIYRTIKIGWEVL